MGFTIDDANYDYVVIPDYMESDMQNSSNIVVVPSHKNVSNNIIERVKERYDFLEMKLCMKQ